MKKLLYITNIPAPYRQKRFNMMAKIFPEYGIDFEVLYMAKIEPDRNWVIPKESYQYKYKIYKGIHPTVGYMFAHFNPGLLLRLAKNDYDIAIIGGMSSPTHWLAPFFIGKKVFKVMSVESNLHSVARTKGFAANLKRTLLKKADAFQITGSPQIDYIKFFYEHADDKPYVKLPNLIDEDVFVDRVNEARKNKAEVRQSFGVDENTQMWVLPARLNLIKGILPFLELINGVENIKLFVLGDGELRDQVREVVDKNSLPVVLTGFVQQDQVVKYYAAADLFVLPSLKDPSPLSPIEACASQLPLLVSSRIGNLEDVLEEGINGWSYDPETEIDKAKNIIESISKLSRVELQQMGLISRKRYLDYFQTEVCLKNYVEQVLELN